MAPATRDLLAPFEPEIVITDTITTVGFFVADLLGIPCIEVSPHHLMDPSPSVPPVGLGRPPARTPWRRHDDERIRRLQLLSIAQGWDLRTKVRAALGLSPTHGAVRRLLAVPPCLEYPRQDWPLDAVVVGPLLWEPPSWPTFAVQPGEEPLVLVTDTTASGAHEGLAVRALRALANAPVRVVATTNDPAALALAERTSNAQAGRGRHAPLLEQADLAVGPGGGGFVGKAARAGVPLLVLPGVGDQRETARRVEVAGIGKRLRHGPLLEARLRIAVLRAVTDPALVRRAAACAEETRGLGATFAVTQVEQVLALRPAS
jgi:UDP:flavonoid glycosyltransferase YjiC (YdhE family)